MYGTAPSPSFSSALASLDGIHRAEDALRGLIWAISNKPQDFPILDETERLRLAKSKKLKKGPRQVILYVWFAINAGGNGVDLLELEIVPVPVEPLVF